MLFVGFSLHKNEVIYIPGQQKKSVQHQKGQSSAQRNCSTLNFELNLITKGSLSYPICHRRHEKLDDLNQIISLIIAFSNLMQRKRFCVA